VLCKNLYADEDENDSSDNFELSPGQMADSISEKDSGDA